VSEPRWEDQEIYKFMMNNKIYTVQDYA